MTVGLARRALAEFLGTGALAVVVVGSGAAAEGLSDDPGIRLLANAIATALGLGVIVLTLAPISGAHINPVVSAVDSVIGGRERLRGGALVVYLAAQVVGAVGGAIVAKLMFEVAPALSTTDRAAPAALLSEVVATAGLVVLVVGLTRAGRPAPVVATAIGAYIGAAYWFTSSTAFANPAVTVGRMLTDTFAGIAPSSALLFIAAQVFGGLVGTGIAVALFPAVSAPRRRGRRGPTTAGA